MAVETATSMRRYLRFNRYLSVQCAPLSPGQADPTPLAGKTLDVGAGGLALLLPETLSVGMSLWIRIDQGETILGRVVWVGQGKSTLRGTRFPHGIAFMQPVDPAVVREWVSRSQHRVCERAPAHFGVDYNKADATFHGTCLNMSEGGMFIATEQPHSPGEEVFLHFTPPGLDQPFLIRARVVWSCTAKTEPGAITGMGVQFVDPTPSEAALIGTAMGCLHAEASSSQDSSSSLLPPG